MNLPAHILEVHPARIEDNYWSVTCRCPISGEHNTRYMYFAPEEMKAWEDGELIQNAFPWLSPDEREFLMTGLTPDQWDALLGYTEEENDG